MDFIANKRLITYCKNLAFALNILVTATFIIFQHLYCWTNTVGQLSGDKFESIKAYITLSKSYNWVFKRIQRVSSNICWMMFHQFVVVSNICWMMFDQFVGTVQPNLQIL